MLRKRFYLGLKAHQESLGQLRQILHEQLFTALWGRRLVLESSSWSVIDGRDPLPASDFLVVWLDPHLRVLDECFAVPEERDTGVQLELWPLYNVRATRQAEFPSEPAHRGST